MKFDKRLYIIPAILVLILLWYPFYNGDSSTTIDEMKEHLIPLVDKELYKQLDDKDLKKYFAITHEEINGYYGFKSVDTMSAEAFIILHVKNQDNQFELKQKIQNYIDSEHKKYDGYSASQVRILDNYTIIEKKGYIYVSIMENDQEYRDTFLSKL